MNLDRLTRLISITVSAVGAVLALFLSWASFAGTLGMICSKTSGCGTVLTSAYSQFLGLPTALYGFIFYFTVALILVLYPFLQEDIKSTCLSFVFGLTTAALVISITLTAYSYISLQALCGYCVTSTIFVFILFATTLFWKVRDVRLSDTSGFSSSAWKVSTITLLIGLSIVGGMYYQQTTLPSQMGSSKELKALSAESIAVGNPEAPIRVVEFFDLSCPHCQRFTRNVFPKINKNYIQNGKVLWTFRPFPIPRAHPHSPYAHSVLAMIPPNQYIEAKKKIMREADQWDARNNDNPETYFNFLMTEYGLSQSPSENLSNVLMENRRIFSSIGIRSTPSFLVNGKIYEGAVPYSRWRTIFDNILRNHQSVSSP